MKTRTPQIIQTVFLVPAEFLSHYTSWTTDYSNPCYRNSRTQSVVPSYQKACISHPIIQTFVATKLANREQVFHTSAFWLICAKQMFSMEDMIIMQLNN